MLNQQQIKDKKIAIYKHLSQFNNQPKATAALNLLNVLGYKSSRVFEQTDDTADFLDDMNLTQKLDHEAALYQDWANASALCQFAKIDLTQPNQQSLVFDPEAPTNLGLYSSFMFVIVELNQSKYTRTQLASIVRELNKHSKIPINVFFYYNNLVSIAFIHRRQNKNNTSKQVLGKVSIIKDIDTKNPKRSHIEILYDLCTLSLFENKNTVNFQEIADAWYKILDTQSLNNRFYKDLRNWYAYANQTINIYQTEQKNLIPIPEREKQQFILRLITRLIFCWFLKEKQFIAEHFFDPHNLKKYLLDFDPNNTQQSQYYKAILQNLFFATLNVETPDREFRNNRAYQGKNSDYFDHSRYRSVDSFDQKENALEELFKDVPFLNGGLFECLDYKDANKKEHRIDYFTDHPQKSKLLDVPNQLFFADDIIVDLSKWYNDLKQNKQKIDGLITLLNHYKFTVEENTPLEEEVALDPELLGKVFENLLAEFNDESQTTKRKETGSFYTPRTIVSYMVAESLKNYFTTQLQTYYPQTLPALLEELFDDNPKKIPTLDTQQKEHFLEAISQLTILDPACGSGAYPMGILHQLTHLLQKIDPDNQLWFEKIVKKLPVGLREDFKKQHDNQRIDYVRKLGIIFDTIYGVDIQPIAIHIAKLRFFISLIIEQQKDEHLPNFGIQTLPNLEFKLVCANTLIGINLQQVARQMEQHGAMFGDPINPVLTQIDDLRKDFFETEKQKDKNKLKQQFEGIQITLKTTLDKAIDNDPKLKTIAQLDQLTQWQPFNDHHSAPFFDPLYMFGIKQGFDVVIGNPPYVRQEKIKDLKPLLQKYEVYNGTSDLYTYFYEIAYLLTKNNGCVSYITNNSWIRAKYGTKLRKLMLDKTTIIDIINFEDSLEFETAIVETNIILFKKQIAPQSHFFTFSKQIQNSNPQLLAQNRLNAESFTLSNNEQLELKQKIEQAGVRLGDLGTQIDYGIKTGFNEAFYINEQQRQALIDADPKNAEIIKPMLRGRDVKKYQAQFAKVWLIATFPTLHLNIDKYPAIKQHLLSFSKERLEQSGAKNSRKKSNNKWFETQDNIAYHGNFTKHKLLWMVVSDRANFTYDSEGYFCNDSMFLMTGDCLKYLLAILNSTVCEWYFDKICPTSGMGTTMWKKVYVEEIPIPPISIEEQRPFEILVDYILFLKKQTDLSTIYATYFEQIINGMVYELYFEEAVTAAKRNIIPHTQQLPDINTLSSDEEKLAMLTNLFETLYHRDHPIRNAVFFMDSIPEIQIITAKNAQ